MSNYNPSAPFQKIPDAARTTGLSEWYLRNAVRAGEIAGIKSGNTYYINIPALLKQFDTEGGGT